VSGAHGAGGAAADRLRTQAARGNAAGAPPVRSPEVTAAVVVLAGIAVAALTGPAIAGAGGELLRLFLARVAGTVADAGGGAAGGAGLAGVLPAALGHTARLAAPLVAAGLAGTVAGHLVQNGVPIRWQSVAPRWRRLAPSWSRLARRMWSGEAAFNVVRELLKVGALAAIAVHNIGAALHAMAAPARTGGGIAPAVGAAFDAALRIAVQSALALVLLAAADYLYRWHRARRAAQRSVAEEREQRRLQEGDPLVRDRLRSRMRALLARTAAEQVAAADVVIADAERAAVALRWDRDTMAAPVVVAKADAAAAPRMRQQAGSNGVAVVEQALLARSLWHSVPLGDAIPRSFQPAVATILAARGTVRGGRREGGA
jgi:flagellar biosynthetic protein FlhB